MAKARKSPCIYCDEKIVIGVSFCTRCGKPTEWASHDERVEYELSQWGNGRRPATKAAKTAPVVSIREVAGATQHVPSPLVRSTPTVRDELPARKVALHPMAQKVRRVKVESVPTAAPEPASVSANIVPTPRPKRIAMKRHEAPARKTPEITPPKPAMADPAVAPEKPMKPAAAKKAPMVSKARADKAAPMKPAIKARMAEKKSKSAAPKRATKRPAVKNAAPQPKAAVVIDLTEPKPAGKAAPKSERSQMLALMERQVELLAEVVERLSALEQTPSMNGAGVFVEAISNGNGHSNGDGAKHRRFWFAKR